MDTGFSKPDLIAYSSDHEERLVVEVKAAIRLRENKADGLQAIRQQYGRKDCYFLFVTPERLFLWLPHAAPDAAPAFAIDTKQVLADRLDLHRFPLTSLDGQQLESVIFSWLLLLQFTPAEQLAAHDNQRWVVSSGLHAAIFQGELTRQAA